MDEYQQMKAFINASAEHDKHRNEMSPSVLQRSLSNLNSTSNLSVFDPGTLITTEFYVSLYNLTNTLTPRMPLIWSVIDVLHHICKNSAARHTLIHTFKFAPLLSRILETNLISEKRLKILKLLQELTYGVKIYSQEAHLTHLISILTQWIMQSKEEEIVTLSLGVLINLCYKNLPVIYILMRTVDTKAFHKMLLTLQSNNINTRVQCCKILLIMEQMNKDIPDKFILEFTMVTFQSLMTALTNVDTLLVRHIVEFFDDVRQNEHYKSIIISYPNYLQDVEKILNQLKEIQDPECNASVMKFLLSLVKLGIPSLTSLYPTYVKVAMQQVLIDQASSKALALLKAVLLDSKRVRNLPDIVPHFDIPILLNVINNEDHEMNGESEKRSIELNSKLTELIQLLLEMRKLSHFKSQVIQSLSEQTMRRLLRPVLEREDLISGDNWSGNLFADATTALHIHALILTADLATQNSNWLNFYLELIQKKQIQMMIALALFTGDSEVKQKCLQLMNSVGFVQESTTAVAKYMSDLEPLILIQNKNGITTGVPIKSDNVSNIDMTPLFSMAQEKQLNAALEKLDNVLKEGKISDLTTSAIMELYEYKLAAMKHAERGIQASHDAANTQVTCLQHRLVQVVAESSRLHQLLFYTQQNREVLQADKTRLNAKLQEVEDESKKIHGTQKLEIQGLKKIVAEKSAKIEQLSKLENDLNVATNKIVTLETKIRDLENEEKTLKAEMKIMLAKNHELNKFLSKLQDSIAKRDQILETKQKELQTSHEGMLALKQENKELMQQCQSYEKIITEKEENVQRLTAELSEFSRMRDMINHITSTKKNAPNETT